MSPADAWLLVSRQWNREPSGKYMALTLLHLNGLTMSLVIGEGSQIWWDSLPAQRNTLLLHRGWADYPVVHESIWEPERHPQKDWVIASCQWPMHVTSWWRQGVKVYSKLAYGLGDLEGSWYLVHQVEMEVADTHNCARSSKMVREVI